MILAAHQPQYLPWLGYFDKMDQVDIFVFLDNVQFKKNEWQNRNRVKGPGGSQWLTVPVRYRFPQKLGTVKIANGHWLRKHRRTLELSYARSPFFSRESTLLDALYGREWSELVSLNTESIRLLARRFDITTPLYLGSEFPDLPDDQADERLLALCQRVGADTYLAGAGGQAYMDLHRWRQAGIRVRFQEFRHPVYTQTHGPFLPALSAVDLLFNAGPEGFSLVRHAREEAA